MRFQSDDCDGGCNTFGQLYNKYSCIIRDLCWIIVLIKFETTSYIHIISTFY